MIYHIEVAWYQEENLDAGRVAARTFKVKAKDLKEAKKKAVQQYKELSPDSNYWNTVGTLDRTEEI